MRPMFALALCSLGAGFACSPASAVSLNQLYDEALETDAQLQSARAGLTADSEQLPQARAKLLPQLSASVTASEQRTEFGGGFPATTGNSNGYTVSLTQPLINVASWQGYQQGQIALTSAQAQFAAARQDLIVRLGQAYFDALSAQDSVTIVRSQKASIAEQLESAKRSFDVGQSTITDTNEAQAKYDQAISQEIAALNDLEMKLAALEQIVGHPVTRVDGLARGVTLPPPVPADMQQWVEMARDANYQVVLKQLAVANSQRETLKAKAGHYPTLDLIASYGKNSLGRQAPATSAGISAAVSAAARIRSRPRYRQLQPNWVITARITPTRPSAFSSPFRCTKGAPRKAACARRWRWKTRRQRIWTRRGVRRRYRRGRHFWGYRVDLHRSAHSKPLNNPRGHRLNRTCWGIRWACESTLMCLTRRTTLFGTARSRESPL